MSQATHQGLFFFNDTATTEIYTLSLHDALPISSLLGTWNLATPVPAGGTYTMTRTVTIPNVAAGSYYLILQTDISGDRNSTRLNSSHQITSYAVFSLKKTTTWLATPPSPETHNE